MAPPKPRRIGEILLERGWITHEQLFRALEKQQLSGGRLGTSLIEIEALSEELLLQALAEQQRIPSASIDELRSIATEILGLVPARVAVRCRAIPFRLAGSQIHVAMMDVKNLAFQDELAFVTAKRVKVYICSEARISEALEKFYDQQCSTRIAQLLDRLNRARYLWDRGVEKPIERGGPGENSAIFVSADKALGPGLLSETVRVLPIGAEPASAPVAAPAAPAPPAPAAPPPVARAAAAPGQFETRVANPAAMASTSFAPVSAPISSAPAAAAAPLEDITRIVPPPPLTLPEKPETKASAAKSKAAAKQASPAPAGGDDLSAAEFEARLLSPKDREEVGSTLVRFLAQSFSRVALFVVRPDAVSGWVGRGSDLDTKALGEFRAEFTQPSVFLNLKQGGDYFLGPLPPMPVHRDLARCWGGEMPRESLILPIRLKGRLVTLIYADRGADGLAGIEVEDFQRLAAKTAIAFELCIMRNKLRNA
ncbi:MAG: hypothetical protein ABI609_16460 [Acidobacteriota bacterium]